jgi:hypothetical protein
MAPRIPTGPIHAAPGGYLPSPMLRALLADALARVELGAWDRMILDWLAGWDAATVVPIISLILRARRAEATSVAGELAGLTPRSTSGPRLPAIDRPEHDADPVCGIGGAPAATATGPAQPATAAAAKRRELPATVAPNRPHQQGRA